ncbi:MAG: hypothetical protein JWN51_561, partial [Phycisphaerales bacterium]|nr:hypothetical protein [Phycisphaerales bacterium]
GNGGSIDTSVPFTGSITSTGSLGDVMLRYGSNVANITAPSVMGNIDLFGGSITGTFQATFGDLGQAIKDATGKVTGVTYVHANLPAGSRLLSYGNLISQVRLDSGLAGVIATQGNIGLGVLTGSTFTRFGGVQIASGATTGQIVALGNIIGDINIHGTLAGEIAAKGSLVAGLTSAETGILGNVIISSGVTSTGAVVSGGLIGDQARGTSINPGNLQGFLAANGAIKLTNAFNSSRLLPNLAGTPKGAVINAIWTSGGQPLSFDLPSQPLAGLALILTDLSALTLSSGGVLSGPIP